MKDMILFPEDIDRLNEVLGQLVFKANLLLAVLINKDGRLLTNQGSLDHIDTVSLAALVAGQSASTLAIANLMGEHEFNTMYHQGKDKHIYIANVDDNTFLSLVFDDRTNIDRVKVFARQFDRQVKQALFQVYEKSEGDIDLDLGMGSDAFSEIPGEPVYLERAADNAEYVMYIPPPEPAPQSPHDGPSTLEIRHEEYQQESSLPQHAPLEEKRDDDVYYVELPEVKPAPKSDKRNIQ